MTIAAVVTAAGSSARFGTGSKKEFELLNERPVLHHAVRPFVNSTRISTIIVTHPAQALAPTRQSLKELDQKKILYTEGGSTRQQSVYAALNKLNELKTIDYVLIHDGARPFLSDNLLNRILDNMLIHNAVIPALELTDTIKGILSDQVTTHPDRQLYRLVQTPQAFDFKTLYTSHVKAAGKNEIFYDDSQIYALSGRPVFWIAGETSNTKITYKEDMEKIP